MPISDQAAKGENATRQCARILPGMLAAGGIHNFAGTNSKGDQRIELCRSLFIRPPTGTLIFMEPSIRVRPAIHWATRQSVRGMIC